MNRTVTYGLMALIVLAQALGASRPWELNLGNYGAVAVAEGKSVYIVGGSGSSFARSGIEQLDVATGQCSFLPVNLIPRRFHAAVIVNREILIFGGESGEGFIATVESVNLDTLEVRRRGKMPTPRRALSAVTADGLVFTLGGSLPQGSDALAREATMEIYDSGTAKWYRGQSMPEPKEVQAVIAGKYIYALGGYNGGSKGVTSCARYDLEAATWSPLPASPFLLSAGSVVNIGRAIVFFGSYDRRGQVVAYIPNTGAWLEIKIPFAPRRHSAATLLNGTVYVVGGTTSSESDGMTLIETFTVAELEQAIVAAALSQNSAPDQSVKPSTTAR